MRRPRSPARRVSAASCVDAALAGVVKRELEERAPGAGRLLEHLLERDVARLEAQMPAERVGAEDQPR